MLSYLKTKLNEEQFIAATHTHTSSLILAWAWSWKTRTLTYKIAYLIYGHNIKPSRIFAVTFTNKAAGEMKERLAELSHDIIAEWSLDDTSEKKDDDLDFDSMLDDFAETAKNTMPRESLSVRDFSWTGTFHSLFLKILKEDIEKIWRWYTNQFTIYDSNESISVIKAILKEKNWQEEIQAREAKGIISKLKNEWITFDAMEIGEERDQIMAKVYEMYQMRLIQSNALDFDDLLLLPYILFREHKEVLEKRQRKYDYMLVDEAQDTNWIQFELIKMISKVCNNVTIIWDDYQGIYWRRGAIIENFLNVKKYRADIEMHKLQINYRSRPHIVYAWSHIIKNNKTQYEKVITPHRKGEDKIRIFSYRDEHEEAIHTVQLIAKLKEEKNLTWSDFAFLYRTNAQSSVLENVLVQEGIPYKIFGAYKFFERKEVKDVVAYLKHLLNPKDNLALQRIINTPWRKVWKTSIDNILEYAQTRGDSLYEIVVQLDMLDIKVSSMARNGIQKFNTIMHSVREQMDDMTPSEIIEMIIKRIEYKQHLVKEEGSEDKAQERYDNIWQLINMAEKYELTGEEGLRHMMEEILLLTDAADSQEEDADSIKLMTVHSSKWLEFTYVFLVWLEEWIFPLSNARLDGKQMEEERRLMYVAVTRAKDHLFLSHAASRMQRWQHKMNPPSRFLDELPEELIKKYDMWWAMFQKQVKIDFKVWDRVRHKLFGSGEVIEIRRKTAVVRFSNEKFGLRKIEVSLLSKE